MASGSKKKADLKIVIVGEASVGKTTLILRYIEGKFQDTISTIGASFFLKSWGKYNAAIWDTAGEEKFSGLSSFYCRGAGAAILAYDISSRDSFNELERRFRPLVDDNNELDSCLKVVVGTKLDLVSDQNRQVTVEEGLAYAKKINRSLDLDKIPFFETSSLSGQNVENLFEYILSYCLPGNVKPPVIKSKPHTDVVHISEIQPSKRVSSKKCC